MNNQTSETPVTDSNPYHVIGDDLRKFITDCVKLKLKAQVKEMSTVDLLVDSYNAGVLNPSHFKAGDMKTTDPLYQDSEFYQIKMCVVGALSAYEQTLLSPKSVKGLGWSKSKRSDRTKAGHKVGYQMRDLQVSFENRIKKAAIAEAERARDANEELTDEQVNLLFEKPSEQTTINVLVATYKRLKANHTDKSPYDLKVNLERIDAILADMLKVPDTESVSKT